MEVILPAFTLYLRAFSILHTCGGDPEQLSGDLHTYPVFSTHVEVILFLAAQASLIFSILHTCGGDPEWTSTFSTRLQYSPHMWR